MASIDNALTTLTRQKQYLEISGSSKDAVLTSIILAVSAFIERYCNRAFKTQTYTSQLINGKGTDKMFLKNTPIDSDATFTLEHRTAIQNEDGWQTVDSELYYIDYKSGKIQAVGGCWEAGVQNYRVTYTAGYILPSDTSHFQDGTDDDKDLPYDLEMLVWDLVSSIYNQKKASGIQSQRVYQVEIVFAKGLKNNPDMKAILDGYKHKAYA